MGKKPGRKTHFENVTPYADILFSIRMEHVTYPGESSKLSEKSLNLIKKHRKNVLFEQFGFEFKKSLPNKDSWVKAERESQSLLGEAPKGILINRAGERFLYKEPKQKSTTNHGFKESLSEHILTELSSFFTPTATTSLAVYKNKIVLISKIFLNSKTEELIHGTQLFSGIYDKEGVDEVQKDRNKQRLFYSLEHILDAFQKVIHTKEQRDAVICDFCMMILTDCFTGNQDRHAENWGLIRNLKSQSFKFSPLFDNARGIFWNETSLQLAIKCQHGISQVIENYIRDSTPMISLSGLPDTSHFDLLEKLTDIHPQLVRRFESKLRELDLDRFMMRFRPMMSPVRHSVVVELLKRRRKKIYEKLVSKGL
jgi:hypothetical protein